MTQDNRLMIDRRAALAIAGTVALSSHAGRLSAATASEEAFSMGRDQDFNHGWRFLRSESASLEAPALDDSAWRILSLPHDYSIEDAPGEPSPTRIGPFDKDSPGGPATGFTIGGDGWYRKHFRLPALPSDARVEILFDGISVTSELWLNGHPLGDHLHGYTPFAFDLTPLLNRRGDNVIVVRSRNMGRNSRWYAGTGIYRDVRLDIIPSSSHIARWGVGAWTRRIVDGRAEIDVTTRLESAHTDAALVTRLLTSDGKLAAEARSAAGSEVKQTLTVMNPRLWSPDHPELYTLQSKLERGDAVLDRVDQLFGVRIVQVDAAQGLRINGSPVKLRGGCIHHDNGLLGACAFPEADQRRIRLLKKRGFNAIRSSHNPTSATLRAACDRYGMLLIEESFDMWHAAKLKDDYSRHFAQDWQNAITAMVMGARNSPSVIMWSIGNEIPSRSTPEGVEWSWKLANLVRQLDPTRPVTAGLNGTLGPTVIPSDNSARRGSAGKLDEASTVFLDVAGYNYRIEDIETDHRSRPERIIYASETFARDAFDYEQLARRAPYFLGEFVWAAMDYLGEAGVGATVRVPQDAQPTYAMSFPWVGAWCGDIDLIGNQKPQSLARDVVWDLSPLEILVQRPIPAGQKELISAWGWYDELPSWTWPGAEGQNMAVRLYTSGDSVDLLLNGQKVGFGKLTSADKMRIEMLVPYAPGKLEAVAYKDGNVIGRKLLETVSAPAKLRLTVETMLPRRRSGLAYVRVEVLDAAGRIVPEAEQHVRLSVTGGAELIGFGSANPLAVGSYRAPDARTYRGTALGILRANEQPGRTRVEATSDGLIGSSAQIDIT
ncbi:glycoside hydrolase family 2 TIM barrel-domain containing protein [Novosphingobium sp. Chol11]|uniref:glycoside hydrolase family 2 TIM barrel-domain containing protein n=1 Tax=Novosphingobium sp. Chol11 TaxID=1385763 RepID=UPI000BE3B6BA|nr:glycoside hydrolase family 2 TIM barrel-domain containing protein [Novosphingobium sp. Chol11]